MELFIDTDNGDRSHDIQAAVFFKSTSDPYYWVSPVYLWPRLYSLAVMMTVPYDVTGWQKLRYHACIGLYDIGTATVFFFRSG